MLVRGKVVCNNLWCQLTVCVTHYKCVVVNMRNVHCWWVCMNIADIYWRQSVTAYNSEVVPFRFNEHSAFLCVVECNFSSFNFWKYLLSNTLLFLSENREWDRRRKALLKQWSGEFLEVCPSQSSKVTPDFIVEPLIWTRLGTLRFWTRRSVSRWRHPRRGLREALYWIVLALIVIRDIGRVFFDLIVYWRL